MGAWKFGGVPLSSSWSSVSVGCELRGALLRLLIVEFLIVEVTFATALAGVARSAVPGLSYTGERAPVGITAAVKPAEAGPFTGEFSHVIPLDVPRGTADFTPSLRLVYSSGGGDSAVGLGWSLVVPKLWRSLKRGVPSYDDGVVGVDDSADTFVLSGDELVRVATDPAGNYHKRVESFERIVHNEASDSWTVTAKDGRVLRFGGDSAHRVSNDQGQTFEWLLAEAEDTHGNLIRYEWAIDEGMACLDTVTYSYRAGEPDPVGLRVVDIVYELRLDQPVSYLAGFRQKLGYRIDNIDVAVAGELLHRYELIHQQSPNTWRSLLTGVDLYGFDADAADPTPPQKTVFGYSENNFNQDTGWEATATDWEWPACKVSHYVDGAFNYFCEEEGCEIDINPAFLVMDVNGDGAADAVLRIVMRVPLTH